MDDGAFARRFDGSAAEFARLFPALRPTSSPKRMADGACGVTILATTTARRASQRPSHPSLQLRSTAEACPAPRGMRSGIPAGRHLVRREPPFGYERALDSRTRRAIGDCSFWPSAKVADTFCGGGSIPFEAARIGCDVYASDLNPIASMLTWGAFNIIGADEETSTEIEKHREK